MVLNMTLDQLITTCRAIKAQINTLCDEDGNACEIELLDDVLSTIKDILKSAQNDLDEFSKVILDCSAAKEVLETKIQEIEYVLLD